MSLRGSEGAAAQAAAETFPIESLVRRQFRGVERAAFEELTDFFGFRVGLLHFSVVDTETFEDLLVGRGELFFFHAAVLPDDYHPAAGFKDAEKFHAGGGSIEPMKGLA